MVKPRSTAATRRRSGTPDTREQPIGIFDSGIGGLTVVQALMRALPRETIIYLGDSARYPYGTKSAEVVRRYSIENAEFLMERGIKALVVACNTSSAIAGNTLRDRFDVPLIEVIEPGAAAAVKATRSGKVGVIATDATISSGEYTRALRRLRRDLEIY